MKTENKTDKINVLHENDIIDEFSLEDIKGGAASEKACCGINFSCNENTPKEPTQN